MPSPSILGRGCCLALAIGLGTMSCDSDSTSDAADRDASNPILRSGGGDSGSGKSESDAGVDGGPDCTNVSTPRGSIARACIYEYPSNSTLAWNDTSYRGVHALTADGGVLGSWDSCACAPSMGFDLIPAGADPGSWVPDAGISVASYDHSCQRDQDCISVFAGDLSYACIGCPNAVIAANSQAAYENDVLAKRQGGIFDAFCGCPASGVPVCQLGTCVLPQLGLPGADAGP